MRYLRESKNNFPTQFLLVILLLGIIIFASVIFLAFSGTENNPAAAVTSVSSDRLEAFGLGDLLN